MNRGFALSRANRDEIQRVLKSLLIEEAPVDDKLAHYEGTICAKITERLRFRKDVLSRKWFKKEIRDAFEICARKK